MSGAGSSSTTAGQALKGILKQQPTTSADAATAAARARETAVAHARILEEQKAAGDRVLTALLTLTELPRVRGGRSAADPAPEDAAEFRGLVRVFQPGDFDDLVAERNTVGPAPGACGYVLCPNRRRKFGGGAASRGAKGGPTAPGGGQWKLYGGEIVERADLEKWCSDECARRAYYVRVQLTETAAWERAGIASIQIDLLPEDEPRRGGLLLGSKNNTSTTSTTRGGENAKPKPAVEGVTEDLARLRIEEGRRAELAAERVGGMGGIGGFAAGLGRGDGPRVDVLIKEKPVVGSPMDMDAPEQQASAASQVIEGYTPRTDDQARRKAGYGV